MLQHIESLHSHRAATETMANAAREELARPVARPQREKAAPSHERGESVDSPARTRPTSIIRRRRSSGPSDEAPLDALFRALGVSLPEDMSGKQRIVALQEVLEGREEKAGDVEGSAQAGFEEGVRGYLGDAKGAVGVLRGCVLGDSPWGRVKLVDEEVEASVGVMEGEVEGVKGRVGGVEGVVVKGEKREELLKMWGE